ncbi:MAG: 23S rRNA (guanosine(2251)-2'-O)-methyltransferase RlmB [Clostridia bacterium]|nr:23S rRNA (guanosine(2251)-2'-O)-methyltransferase RlmB [Clostridia bacterium]
MDDCITSMKNPLIKRIRSLNIKKYRDQYNRFIIEGTKIVDEFIDSGASIDQVLYSDKVFSMSYGDQLIEKLEDNKIENIKVDDNILKQLCNTKTPQGILAVVKKIEYQLCDVIDKAELLIIIDGVQDPGNLGTIIRTADAVNVDGIIVSQDTVDVYNDKTIRSTMGSILRVPVVKCSNLGGCIQKLRGDNFFICAADVNATSYYFDIIYPDKTALLIGNESRGIDDGVLAVSDKSVKIPMPGGSESLNVSIATAVILYEVLRQRISVSLE